jgi:hypothetical protein
MDLFIFWLAAGFSLDWWTGIHLVNILVVVIPFTIAEEKHFC